VTNVKNMNFIVNKSVIVCYFGERSSHTKSNCYRKNDFPKRQVRVLNLMETRRFALIVEETVIPLRLVIRNMIILVVTNFIMNLEIFVLL